MRNLAILSASAITLLSLVQPCAAGIAAAAYVAAGIAGSIVGGVAGNAIYAAQTGYSKRDDSSALPSDCKSQIVAANMTLTLKPNNGLLIDGIPPACMKIAEKMDDPIFGTLPTLIGDSALEYANVTDSELQQILPALSRVSNVAWNFEH